MLASIESENRDENHERKWNFKEMFLLMLNLKAGLHLLVLHFYNASFCFFYL